MRREVGIGFTGQVLAAAVAFLGSIVIARTIGDTGYGAYYTLLTFVAVLDNPFTGWFHACRKRFTEEGFDAEVAVGAALLGLGAGILAASIAMLGGFRQFGVLFIASLIYVCGTVLLKSTSNFGKQTWVESGREVLRVALQIGLVLIVADVWGMILGLLVANLLVIPLIIKYVNVSPQIPTLIELRNIFEYAKSSIPSKLVGTTIGRIDILLLSVLATSGVVGNYQVAMNITLPAVFLSSIIQTGTMNRVSMESSGDENPSATIQRSLNFTMIFSIPLAAGALVVGDLVVVTAYSAEFELAGYFVAGLALFRVFESLTMPMMSVIDGSNRPDLVLRYNTFTLALNVALGVVLFRYFGPFGILYATILASIASAGLMWRWVRREYDVTLLSPIITRQIISGFLMLVIVYLFRQSFQMDVINIMALIVLGGFCYFTALFGLSRGFRELVFDFIDIV